MRGIGKIETPLEEMNYYARELLKAIEELPHELSRLGAAIARVSGNRVDPKSVAIKALALRYESAGEKWFSLSYDAERFNAHAIEERDLTGVSHGLPENILKAVTIQRHADPLATTSEFASAAMEIWTLFDGRERVLGEITEFFDETIKDRTPGDPDLDLEFLASDAGDLLIELAEVRATSSEVPWPENWSVTSSILPQDTIEDQLKHVVWAHREKVPILEWE